MVPVKGVSTARRLSPQSGQPSMLITAAVVCAGARANEPWRVCALRRSCSLRSTLSARPSSPPPAHRSSDSRRSSRPSPTCRRAQQPLPARPRVAAPRRRSPHSQRAFAPGRARLAFIADAARRAQALIESRDSGDMASRLAEADPLAMPLMQWIICSSKCRARRRGTGRSGGGGNVILTTRAR